MATNELALAPEDLSSLPTISVETVVAALSVRAVAGNIYSRCGPLLVAVNPYENLPLYTPENLARYLQAADPATLPPHVFAVGAACMLALTRTGRSQNVVVSGESGAGKTETSKWILTFLSEAAVGDKGTLHLRVLETNPVLEALGCAATARNENSSRFGKFISVRFDSGGRLRAARITTYLLEKSRVTRRCAGESNFHGLYQMLAGADTATMHSLRLDGASGATAADGQADDGDGGSGGRDPERWRYLANGDR
eukprot:6173242-Pleurochrysis_carterae.AAC.1